MSTISQFEIIFVEVNFFPYGSRFKLQLIIFLVYQIIKKLLLGQSILPMKELDIPMMNENSLDFLSKAAEYRMYLCIHPKLTGGD